MPATRTAYDNLLIIPALVAESVTTETYTGQNGGTNRVAEVEIARQKMTPNDVTEFIGLADKWCRDAYAATGRANWFHKLARSKTNHGRDTLYMFVRHWLSAYLLAPDALRQNIGAPTVNRRP